MNTFWVVFALFSGSFWTWVLMTRRAQQKLKVLPPPAVASAPEPLRQHPCAVFHFFEVISTRHIQLACIHTSVLSRCKICGQHKTDVHPGEFDLRDFVRTTNEITELKGMFH